MQLYKVGIVYIMHIVFHSTLGVSRQYTVTIVAPGADPGWGIWGTCPLSVLHNKQNSLIEHSLKLMLRNSSTHGQECFNSYYPGYLVCYWKKLHMFTVCTILTGLGMLPPIAQQQGLPTFNTNGALPSSVIIPLSSPSVASKPPTILNAEPDMVNFQDLPDHHGW